MHGHAALVALLSIPALVAPAAAQADGRPVLEAAAQAVRETPGFTADFRLLGDGSEMVKASMPALSGRLAFGRPGGDPALRMHGVIRDRPGSEEKTFDILRTPERVTWTDDARQAVSTRPARPEPRDAPTAARLMHLSTLIDDAPFEAALTLAESVVHEGAETVGGTPCDVVLVTFPAGTDRRASGHTAERWAIGTADRLPRRLEQITDAGMVKIVLTTELTDLSVGAPPAGELDVRRPEGYATDDRAGSTPARAPAPRAVPRPEPAAPAEPAPDPEPSGPRAPDFRFTPEGGDEVTNATQAGRVTVLYFWGTWCIPCRAVSPEISAIAERYADRPVDVFAPAVRERDPSAARASVRDAGHAQRLVLNADRVASDFGVRIYPTVVVVGPDGALLFQGHPDAERDAAALGEAVDRAVREALAQTAP